ncbi:hypothetical protein LE181_07045 [Streptomyces sp. SCA3-4]|uniref:hypothetical protein n=1 Tax=Streptomyces sichuanensis TaxID=2871810 RepID=UPI001CE34394|nr:hypothetical protein [Streptomyces sichuanensis]MCA6091919.1 hypothetical protein [Streptomyces sichuanensis]
MRSRKRAGTLAALLLCGSALLATTAAPAVAVGDAEAKVVTRAQCRLGGGTTDPWRGGFCHGGEFDGYLLSD